MSHYYPQISIAADWSRGRSYLTALQSIKTTEVNTDVLYLKQTIYDFGRTSGVVDAARSNLDAADYTRTITRQDVALRVRSGFYLLLAAEKQVIAIRNDRERNVVNLAGIQSLSPAQARYLQQNIAGITESTKTKIYALVSTFSLLTSFWN